jgi:hypothetical protein
MYGRHPSDTSLASHVSDERIRRAAEERRARMARRDKPQSPPLRPVGRLLVRLGIYLGGGPETPVPTTALSTVRPR